MQLFVNRSLIKSIMQVVDEDGSIKDSAVGFFFDSIRFYILQGLHNFIYLIFFLYLFIYNFIYLTFFSLPQSPALKQSQGQVQMLERKVLFI